jgi:hypothetical protein
MNGTFGTWEGWRKKSSGMAQRISYSSTFCFLLHPFIYLLHLSKNFLFKNLLHISLGLARIYCPFAAHWLPPSAFIVSLLLIGYS